MRPHWRYVASIYIKKFHFMVYRDERLKVQLEIRRRIGAEDLEGRKRYWADDYSKSFKSEKYLLAFLTNRGFYADIKSGGQDNPYGAGDGSILFTVPKDFGIRTGNIQRPSS